MSNLSTEPLKLRGASISYFTGKMENYFRLKGIPYQLEAMNFPSEVKRNQQRVGISQMPVVGLPDGRWMTDSTKMIQWFEGEYPQNPVVPEDPVLAYICYLVEDWADEWWWRPAMHYRWYYEEGARFASGHLAREVMDGYPLPLFGRRIVLRRRQRQGYTVGDGIGPDAVAGVEADVATLLALLERIFEARPFLLGDYPTLADIGFSGPFFRHFALDPIPLQILRHTAPRTLEWVMRLWNSSPSSVRGSLVDGVPGDIRELLKHMARGYLPYLNANVEAIKKGDGRFTATVDGVTYRGARSSQYRIWCLDELRRQYRELTQTGTADLELLLRETGIWEPLWAADDLPLLKDQESRLPFWADSKMTKANE
jgi:glutathione S-transferase